MIRGGGQTSVDKHLIESCKNAHKKYADYLEKKKKEKEGLKERQKKWYIVTLPCMNYFFPELLEISHTSTSKTSEECLYICHFCFVYRV